jgi:endonuclease III
MSGQERLQKIVSKLQAHYGPPEPPISTDPFDLILFENIAYLVSDERRKQTFSALRKQVGTKPHEILSAPPEALLEVTTLGGMQPARRAAILREIAMVALNEFEGNLRQILTQPLPKAKRSLKKFWSIGDPGAEKILLFARAHPVLALESNGLRVLRRLGFGEEKKDYAATYRSVQESVKDQLKADFDWLINAHLLLRRHGKELCKSNRPLCQVCPLRKVCRYFRIVVRK